MTVTLTPEAEALVQQKVDAGGYATADEVIRAALRLLDERDRRREEWDAAIAVADEQVARGQVTPWSRGLGAEIFRRAIAAARAGKQSSTPAQ